MYPNATPLETSPKYSYYRSLFKLGLITGYILMLCFLFYFIVSQRQLLLERASQKKELVASFPYRQNNVIGYGRIIEPLVKLNLKYPSGYRSVDFLVDSGAMISSLPAEVATEMGINLAFLPRQTFRGFGNRTSFAYRGKVQVQLTPSRSLILPVIFTESSGTKYLLGRYGFFDLYSVEFNHLKQNIEIYQ